jgi:branched-chain amino acid transport system permease protein
MSRGKMDQTNLISHRKSWQQHLFDYTPYIFFGLLLLILPPFLPNFLQSIATKFLIFAIFAMSLDIIFGYTGLWSLGHAAYFGAAGYTFGILTTTYGVQNFWLAALAGIVMATILAAFFGIFALRVSGLYFMIVTFALAMLCYSFAWSQYELSGGYNGFPVTRADLYIPWFTWDPSHIYYLVLTVFVISYLILQRIVKSPFGRALEGIRDDEGRMRHLGYNTWTYKYVAFIIAGLFAGVAGVLWAPFNRLIAPTHIGFSTSVAAMMYVIIGGAGKLFGGIIGAAVIVFVGFGASLYAPERWPLILGIVFIIVVMFLPNGIAPYMISFWNKIKARYSHGNR